MVFPCFNFYTSARSSRKKYSSNCLSCCSFCILSFLSGLSVYWNNISSSISYELFCVCCSIKASMCKITPTDKNRRQWHHKGTSPPHRYFKQRIQVTRPFFTWKILIIFEVVVVTWFHSITPSLQEEWGEEKWAYMRAIGFWIPRICWWMQRSDWLKLTDNINQCKLTAFHITRTVGRLCSRSVPQAFD